MKKSVFRNSLISTAVLLAGAAHAYGQSTTTLSVAVAPEAAINVTTGTTSLSETTVGTFGFSYTGTTNFTYKVRSSKTGGGGAITVKILPDFTPTGGPSVASPLTGDAMTYSCTAAASATACTGPVTASNTGATSVATCGTDAHNGTAAGDAGTVVWTLPNDPVYKTGTYTATATFTISAT